MIPRTMTNKYRVRILTIPSQTYDELISHETAVVEELFRLITLIITLHLVNIILLV